VSKKTVLHHVRSEELSRVTDEDYRFCPDRNCATVYYSQSGSQFLTSDVRDSVSAKTSGDGRPICYCFGFTEGHVRRGIGETSASTVAQRITQLIRAGMCDCEVRNPAGNCCLGQLMQTVARIVNESKESE
jgi:hypothetical protein